jgi:CBS domain-containing protein
MEDAMGRLMRKGVEATVPAGQRLFLGGLGLGSLVAFLAAFFADGRLGRRRRALASAKARHLGRAGARRLGRSKRGLVNRSRGAWARLRARLRSDAVPDEVIEQRVRAALGRVASHVSAIDVLVEDGRVALGGPILESEHRRVVRTARRVIGVRGLDDWLEEHRRPDIPELSDVARVARAAANRRRCASVMKTVPQSVNADDPIRLAAEIMSAANIGFLPVCDEGGKVVGTVTDRDIVVRAIARGLDPALARVTEVMSRDVVACRPEDELTLAEQFMANYQISRLVITDDDGTLEGVISLSDIAEHEPARRAARTLRAVAAREAPRPC